MTADQVKRVEIETRGQSTNDLWHQQRIGRVTASNFHTYHTQAQSILNRKGQNVKKTVYSSLVSSLLSKSDDVSHLPQIKWGTAHEKDAIKAFMSDVASQHDGGLQGFKQCGLFIKPDYPCLTTSPDGLFLCKCCGLSIVEAKCPYTVRNEHIHVKDTFDRVDFLEDFHGKPRLKRSQKLLLQPKPPFRPRSSFRKTSCQLERRGRLRCFFRSLLSTLPILHRPCLFTQIIK